MSFSLMISEGTSSIQSIKKFKRLELFYSLNVLKIIKILQHYILIEKRNIPLGIYNIYQNKSQE